jgi:hypothetical protein
MWKKHLLPRGGSRKYVIKLRVQKKMCCHYLEKPTSPPLLCNDLFLRINVQTDTSTIINACMVSGSSGLCRLWLP